MVKTKELCEDIRSAIISKHKTSKGYEAISKDLGIPVSHQTSKELKANLEQSGVMVQQVPHAAH